MVVCKSYVRADIQDSPLLVWTAMHGSSHLVAISTFWPS